MYDTQLNDYKLFTPDKLKFRNEIIKNEYDEKNFQKIKISYLNTDGSIGDLIFSAPENLFSYGIQELKDSDNNLLGYIMPIILHKSQNPRPEELLFISKLEEIIELCKKEVEEYVEGDIDFKRFSPLFHKKDSNKSPILYAKLMYNKKENKINSYFIDESTNEEIDPLTLIQKKCYITCAIKIESIFIGNKITIQIKIYEGIVRAIRQPRKLLLTSSKLN
jgi:hypothetical protein